MSKTRKDIESRGKDRISNKLRRHLEHDIKHRRDRKEKNINYNNGTYNANLHF
jgi:hypothetical protein